MLAAVLALQAATVDAQALPIRDLTVAPARGAPLDTTGWGPPPVTIRTRQGQASIWLLRAEDTVFVAARIADRTASWADALSVCLDVAGDRAAAPADDDFQFTLRRVLDSSVVLRGRAGRWQPPLDDPDWRVGPAHGGGGWEAATAGDASGWSVVLRLDPAWFVGQDGRRPGIAFIIHDDDPNGWFGWPSSALERSPWTWMPVGPGS